MQEISVNLLAEFGEKWLFSKIQRMRNLLKIAEPDEALYREIMLSLGYPKNKVQFLELALILPFREIKNLREKNKIEKALLYRAGFIEEREDLPANFDFSLRMDKSVWNFRGIRPANYPDKRIKGIVYLLSTATSCGLVEFFQWRLVKASEESATKTPLNPQDAKNIVKKIMDFEGIGIQRKEEMFFNIILPFFMAFLEDKETRIIDFLNTLFKTHPPLAENSVIKKFKTLFQKMGKNEIPNSTLTYFGIHYYFSVHKGLPASSGD